MQKYGHTKSFCHRKPKCIKCAGDHFSIDCPRKKSVSHLNSKAQNTEHISQNTRPSVSYAQAAREAEFNTSEKPPSNETNQIISEMREMMSFLKQMMQQMTSMTNLLVNLLSKPAASMN